MRTLQIMLGLGLAVLSVTTAAAPAVARNSGGRPNVVIIETDDQTQESIRVMANVDKLLARKGTTFTNSFVSYSLCCPSRASFLTGQYSFNSGVQGNLLPLGGYPKLDSTNTLAVWLQRAGYYTALVGKYLNGYGNGNPPANAPTAIPPGWSEWHGSVDPSTYRYYGYTLNEGGVLSKPPGYQTDVYAGKAAELIRRRAASDQPLFLWTTFLAPHSGQGEDEPDDPNNLMTPIPAPQDRDKFATEPVRTDGSYDEADVSDKPAYIRNRPLLNANRQAAIRENYQQRLETVVGADRGVFTILDALRASGELDDTLVIFTSDNGFFHGEHRIVNGKIWPYEPSIRVPLIMRGPGVPRGETRSQLAANVDLAPTILAATGSTGGRLVDGRSLLPLLDSPEIEYGRDILLTNGPDRADARPGVGSPRYSGVRSRNYVYIEYDTGEKELYDLVNDPSQVQNQSANPAYDAIRSSLAMRLAQLRACKGSACTDRPSLTVKLSYSSGRAAKGRKCAAGDVAAKLSGADRTRVKSADLYVDGEKVKDRDSSTLRLRASRSQLEPASVLTLRPRIVTDDDRALSLLAKVRTCA